MTSTTPEFVVLTSLLLATAALVFVYVRRRVGPWPALIAAVAAAVPRPRLAGPALALPDRLRRLGPLRRGDAAGAGPGRSALATSPPASFWRSRSASPASGLPFAVGRAWTSCSDGAARPASRLCRRRAVAALRGAGTLGWGHDAESHLSLHNVLVSPRYSGEGLAASLDSLLALGTIANEAVGRSQWGCAAADRARCPARLRAAPQAGLLSPVSGPSPPPAATFWLLAGVQLHPRPGAVLEPVPLRRGCLRAAHRRQPAEGRAASALGPAGWRGRHARRGRGSTWCPCAKAGTSSSSRPC